MVERQQLTASSNTAAFSCVILLYVWT